MFKYSFLLLFSCLLLSALSSNAQFEKGKYIVPAKIVGNDTLPFVTLQTVEIIGELNGKDLERIRQYVKLRNKVIKVWPFANYAAAMFKDINDRSLAMSPKERRQFIKDEERKAKEKYEAKLKALTFSEGKLLIKLVDRQTGQSSYALVKELKGNMSAFFWQSLARLFGSSLKMEYDSLGEDREIEKIVKDIEAGRY